ncbi:MAG: GNAT family N-acetyltransferase, partial [Anaerolineae bacterium]
ATLQGRRVTLRPYSRGFTDAELKRLLSWARDPDVLELAGGSPLNMSFERFRNAFLAQLPRRNTAMEQQFAILDENGEIIGRIGLFGMRPGSDRAELGVVIGDQAFWGRGYGRDAVGTLVDFGFDQLGLRSIKLYTLPENHRAQAAFEASGFARERMLERFSFERGTHAEIEMLITPQARAAAEPAE